MGCDRTGVTANILAVRSPFVTFYVLRRQNSLFLIDTGFLGGPRLLAEARKRAGWANLPIEGVLLTHGHLDHVFNAAVFAREFGAWVAAPRLDERHCAGAHPYRGLSRVCGWMEAAGRAVLPWTPFSVSHWIDDGMEIPGCGLQAVHLPGHTAGHTGYFDQDTGLLFSADLFASGRRGAELPPPIFNSEPSLIPASIARVLALPVRGLLPCHGDRATPEKHLDRLRNLAREF
jgi:glyoxylase-like metal-dependent hydrolase (beta-lactamase superfamily II)